MGKKSISRTEAETAEGLKVVSNDIPDNRIQADQQVQTTDDALKVKPEHNGFGMKKSAGKGSKLKQEVVAEVLSGGSDSGMGIGANGRNVSGTAGGILTADNSTPVADKVRNRTRVGKKLDRLATKLNYTPSEQALIVFDESKPLADAAGDDQGYNGSYRNEFARSQKASGAVPGDLMFERSVDFILKDKLYFTQGQIVLPANTETAKLAYTPTRTYIARDNYGTYKAHVGDFLTRAAHIKVDENGLVRYIAFEIEDVTAYETDPDMANKSAAHRLIHSNRSELDRIAMDSKAGDEKADIWCPLPRAVNQPSKTIYLLSAIEAQVGAHAYVAYSKASTNFSYQLNRAVKDGQDINTPAVEEALGLVREYNSGAGYTGYRANLHACFNATDYRTGAASLIVPMYDSIAKYNNKADWLLQPRGPRMHLQTADNNINPLKVDETFVQVFAGQECFSTIEHEYDPLLPICMTDKCGLIDRINMNELGAFVRPDYFYLYTGTNIEDNGDYIDSAHAYDEVLAPACFVNQTIYVYQKITAGAGIVKLSNGKFGLKKDGTNRTNARTDIKLSWSSVPPTGYTLVDSVDAGNAVVLSCPVPIDPADDEVGESRIHGFTFNCSSYDTRLYIENGGPYRYAYSDLRNNYVVTVFHPLVEGIVKYLEESIGSKVNNLLGRSELYLPWVFSTQYASLASYIICAATPWIQQVRLVSMKDVLYYEENVHQYPFSGLISIKDAPFKNFVNFEFEGYDEPLKTKVMQPTVAITWVMPEFFWHIDDTYEDYCAPWYFNQGEFDIISGTAQVDPQNAAMSMPSIRSGIRLSVFDMFYGMSEKDIRLSFDRMTPRLLDNAKVLAKYAYKYGRTTDGQVVIRFGSNNDPFTKAELISAPRELGLTCEVPGYVLTPNGTYGVDALNTNGMGTSYRIKVWTSAAVTNPDFDILDTDAVDIHRGANYTQRWFQIDANTGNSNEQLLGMVFGLNDEGAATFEPFTNFDESDVSNAPEVVSHQRSLWTRIQMLPFAISPFDAEPTTGSANRDIYDMLYVFGLAGFRASDYRESVYNRSKEVVNQGMLFVSDPWVEASPIVKHGAESTGVKITKGYVLGK